MQQRGSGTYGIIEDVIRDILSKLRNVGTYHALEARNEGISLYRAWLEADPTNGGRSEHTARLRLWIKTSVDLISS